MMAGDDSDFVRDRLFQPFAIDEAERLPASAPISAAS